MLLQTPMVETDLGPTQVVMTSILEIAILITTDCSNSFIRRSTMTVCHTLLAFVLSTVSAPIALADSER